MEANNFVSNTQMLIWGRIWKEEYNKYKEDVIEHEWWVQEYRGNVWEVGGKGREKGGVEGE